jgi:hypothetical protein
MSTHPVIITPKKEEAEVDEEEVQDVERAAPPNEAWEVWKARRLSQRQDAAAVAVNTEEGEWGGDVMGGDAWDALLSDLMAPASTADEGGGGGDAITIITGEATTTTPTPFLVVEEEEQEEQDREAPATTLLLLPLKQQGPTGPSQGVTVVAESEERVKERLVQQEQHRMLLAAMAASRQMLADKKVAAAAGGRRRLYGCDGGVEEEAPPPSSLLASPAKYPGLYGCPPPPCTKTPAAGALEGGEEAEPEEEEEEASIIFSMGGAAAAATEAALHEDALRGLATTVADLRRRNGYLFAENRLLRGRRDERQALLQRFQAQEQLGLSGGLATITAQQQQLLRQQEAMLHALQLCTISCFEVGVGCGGGHEPH